MRSEPKQSPSDASSIKTSDPDSNTSKLIGVMSMKDLPSESCKEKNNFQVPTKRPLQLYCSDLTPSVPAALKSAKDVSSVKRDSVAKKKDNSVEKYLLAKAFKMALLPGSIASRLLKSPAKNVAKSNKSAEHEPQVQSPITPDAPINLVTRRSLSCSSSPMHVEPRDVSFQQKSPASLASLSPLNSCKVLKAATEIAQPTASRYFDSGVSPAGNQLKQFKKVYPKQFEKKFASLQQGIQLQMQQQQLLQMHQRHQMLYQQQNSSKQSPGQTSSQNPPPYTQAAIEHLRNAAALQFEISKKPGSDPKMAGNLMKKSSVKQSANANQLYKHPKPVNKARSSSHVAGTRQGCRKMQPVSELLARLRGVSKDDIARMNSVPNAGKRARRVHNIVHIPVSRFVFRLFVLIKFVIS